MVTTAELAPYTTQHPARRDDRRAAQHYRGKVRDNYDLAAVRLIIATDRLSAFDKSSPHSLKYQVLTRSPLLVSGERDICPQPRHSTIPTPTCCCAAASTS